MKRIPIYLIVLTLITFGCEDEPIDDMNAINEEWQIATATLEEIDAELEKIMEKYKAASMHESKEEKNKVIQLYDANKTVLEIVKEDADRLSELVKRKRELTGNIAKFSDVDGVYTHVAQMPEPKGGIGAFYLFLAENMKYPTEAKANNVEGMVFIQFTVTEHGEIKDAKVLKGIGHGCDEEALRALMEYEGWEPGQHEGKMVDVRMVLPVTFKLGPIE